MRMRKRLISVCIVVILVYSIFGCARIPKDTPVTEMAGVEAEYAKTGQEEKEEIAVLPEEEKTILSDQADNMMIEIRDALQDYEKTRTKVIEAEKQYDNLLKKYNIKSYVDSAALTLDIDGAGKAYIERYFRIEKEELQRIIGEVTKLDARLPGQDEFGILLPAGDKIWVRYGAEDDQPVGLVIQNPLIDIGYMDARVGRDEALNDIQRRYPDSELEFIQYDWGYVHYLRYEDADFVYYYADTSVFQEPTILYIEPKKEIEANRKDRSQEKQPDSLADTGTNTNSNPNVYADIETNVDPATNLEQYGALYDSVKGDIEKLLEESAQELHEIEDRINILQVKYDLLALLEYKGNEDDHSAITYGKYFQLKQEELARREEINDLSAYEKFGFLNSHFSGPIIQIDDSISIQYINEYYILEDILPTAVIIIDAGINLGYLDARAGMDFEEIQEKAYEKDIEEGFMYSWETPVYYIQYHDGYYEYTFISDDAAGQDSWLIVR